MPSDKVVLSFNFNWLYHEVFYFFPRPFRPGALLFPLCLVLFEFAVYIANDMIQPGIMAVVESFNVSHEWVPTSMTAYLAGGMVLQWLLDPLSDRRSRRPMMLAGVILFIGACLGILLVNTIEQFIAMRFLQGFGAQCWRPPPVWASHCRRHRCGLITASSSATASFCTVR